MNTLSDYGQMVERALERLFPSGKAGAPVCGEVPPLLADAMRYSLSAGGKRLRPSMLLAAVDMLGGDLDEALPAACALEMIHTYSLIHDDLPCMDDDDMRRGKPSNHMIFGEAQAMLAGDGLLTCAFEWMSENAARYPSHAANHIRAIHEIARAAGARGMVAGQCMDLYCERESISNESMLRYIHENKTAQLFIGAMRAAGRLCAASNAQMDALERYGRCFGLLFQATDDILDVVGDAKAMGKTLGKDEKSGKLTLVSLMGLPAARAEVGRLRDEAKRALQIFEGGAAFFVDLIDEMVDRTH